MAENNLCLEGEPTLFQKVKSKFGLSDAAELQIFDETDTAVEEDILLELMEANPDLCLTVCDSFLGEGWDSDMASLLLLLYLLSSTAGRKRTKISRSDAVDKMVHSTSHAAASMSTCGEERVNNLYNIDINITDESPRIRELRAKLLK
ncbi:ACT domain containing protein ACR3 [Dissostichus eleginoides]|uniref:ACT domain containing protein ACR3 n=1 Tax=Dissostichus eleginoides TaxID=100907 RepID=A0AAD9B2W0_DISEL|nr:ACT domain containing protein ACR3 [Dissostichus eleginoides]